MRNHRSVKLAGAALLAALLTAACGDTSGPAGTSSVADSEYGAKESAGTDSKDSGGYDAGDYGSGGNEAGGAGGGARTGPAGTLTLTASDKLGSVVTDAKGWTLYRFDKDTADPPASNCDGDCATTWPPVRADEPDASDGIDPELIGSVKRKDGTQQLTMNGWPVYRYAKDKEPGDTTGHGVGGTWSAISKDGGKASTSGAGQQDAEQQEEAAPLRAEQNAQLGEKILVDAKGRTLYRFDKDSAWPMKTACTGECLTTWKPAKPVDKNAVQDVKQKLVNTFTRPDGSKQLAIDCWLLYWYTGDKKPGDINGQGVKGVWHAVKPDGKKITS
ncbi:SCO0930 family lipoprotein [Streptomyces boninensis]|uniref:SCO0930 family lipoprotein n=1 Tax=Streptomyces boninensis TaxID=2039455 RepID=UPI003B214E30